MTSDPQPGTASVADTADGDHAHAIVDGVDVDAVAQAVEACPSVADLTADRFGQVTSYLPGRRLAGVAVDGAPVTVQVRVRWNRPADQVLQEIEDATAAIRAGKQLRVVIADVADPADSSARTSTSRKDDQP